MPHSYICLNCKKEYMNEILTVIDEVGEEVEMCECGNKSFGQVGGSFNWMQRGF